MAIYITQEATVQVRAPMQIPQKEIERFIHEKEPWIIHHLARRQAVVREQEQFQLTYGSQLYYRGREYPLVARAGRNYGFDIEGFYMPYGLDEAQIKVKMVEIYRSLAKEDLKRRVEHYAVNMGVSPKEVKVNQAKSRWGSCSSRGNLNFSWKIIMAEDRVIDYVVVHELSHLKEMNHSSKFWAVVKEIMPDYHEQKQKLKILQSILQKQQW